MVILSALGLPGCLLQHDTIPFTIKSYQFFRFSSSECSDSWLFFHSCFTFRDH